MYHKLFILKEFYFLILELNMRPHHKYLFKWLLNTKTKESKINESLKRSALE